MVKWLKITVFNVVLFFVFIELLLYVITPELVKRKLIPSPQSFSDTTVIKLNKDIKNADSIITIHYNNIGLRGPDFDSGDSGCYRIITIGGSTTACSLLSDGKDWTSLLGRYLNAGDNRIWINNGGVDGMTTLGSTIRMNNLIRRVKPDLFIFLVGRNEMTPEGISYNEYLKRIDASENTSFFRKFKFVQLIGNVYSTKMNNDYNFRHYNLELNACDSLKLTDKEMETFLKERTKSVTDYELKIRHIIKLCSENGVKLILITQPTLIGDKYEVNSGKYLGNIRFGKYENGILLEKQLDMINKSTIKVAQLTNTKVVRLSEELPANIDYYYDPIHFSAKGCDVIARIIANNIRID